MACCSERPLRHVLAVRIHPSESDVNRRPCQVRFGSWPCKNTLSREVGEKSGPVRSQATIAAISGLIPTMFMTRVRL